MIKKAIISLLPRQGRILRGLSKGLRFNATGGTLWYLVGNAEHEEEKAISALLQEGDIVYDVGANIGYYAIGIARKVGSKGHVYAFEPSADASLTLKQNITDNNLTNTTIVPKAVSDKTGSIVFHLSENGTMSSIQTGYVDNSVKSVEMPTISLDDFVFIDGNPPPKFVLIDVEGAELLVLEGMKEVLKQHKPTIICEIHWLGQAVIDIQQGLLKEVGYEIKTIAGEEISNESVRYHALIKPI
jgi:FkbM family methyltransferase